MKFPHCEENEYSALLLKKFIILVSLTSILTFISGNLLLLDKSTFITSIGVALASQVIIFAIFSIGYLTRSLTWGLAAIYATLAIGAFFNLDWLYWIILASGFFGFLIFIKTSYKDPRAIDVRDLTKAVILGSLVIISAKTPVSFDMIDRLESGLVHRDTLFHASIASMIKSYSVISTGLNGLVETPYHILSHTLIAAISTISATGILETYGLAPPLLFLPLLIGSIAYTTSTFGKTGYFYRYFMLTGFILAVAPRLFKTFGLKESYFGSESYSIALSLMLVTIPFLFRKSYKYQDLALITIMLALMTLAKASVGSIFIGLLATRIIWFVRSKNELPKELMLFIICAFTIYYILSPSLNALSPDASISYWEYVKLHSLLGEYVSGPFYLALIPITLFISLHFVFSWITIKSRINIFGTRFAVYDHVSIYSLAAVIGGLSIIILPIMPDSIAYYFSGVAMFVSLPWLIILMAEKRINRVSNPFLTALIIILILKSSKLLDKTLFKRDHIPEKEHIAFVSTLLNNRDAHPSDTYLKPDNLTVAEKYNPINICMAKPFIYPAVTERAWVGAINMDANCEYKYYAFNHYFEDKGTNKTLLPAGIPVNTNLITINF